MIQINIKKINSNDNWARCFLLETEADQWLAQEIANGSFGKLEQQITEEDGSITIIPAEFEVEKIDVGNEPLMASLRAERNAKLNACDWTQLQDAPLSDEKKQEWAAYRQSLRDLPALPDLNFENIPWPQKP